VAEQWRLQGDGQLQMTHPERGSHGAFDGANDSSLPRSRALGDRPVAVSTTIVKVLSYYQDFTVRVMID